MHLHIQHATIHMAPPAELLGLTVRGEVGDTATADLFQKLTPPPLGEYWTGQGGIYCGIAPAADGEPARHLVFSVDELERATFGPSVDIEGAKSHHNGKANTAALLASGQAHPAAAWANAYEKDGHKDFHLPSHTELMLAWIHAADKFNSEGYYWSSTQGGRNDAFVQAFASGSSYWGSKDYGYRVRAVRTIQL